MTDSSPDHPQPPAQPDAAGKPQEHHEEHHEELPKPWSPGSGILILVLVVLVLAMAAFFVIGFLPRHHEQEDVATQSGADAQTVLRVRIAKAVAAPAVAVLHLPGTITPMQQTLLYARATGYVTSWQKDLGEKVRKGQLLAVISAPDVDAQLAQAKAAVLQARAQVEQAKASLGLAKISMQRLKTLGPTLAAQQDIDNAQATYVEDQANLQLMQAQVVAAQANVQHLNELVAFQQVSAPFDGVITARYVEVGNLVTSGSSAQQLFQVSQVDPIRIFVDVPQSQSTNVKVGQKAAIAVREYGGTTFPGTVTHIAQALDPAAHTMSTEITIPNGDGRLLPGMYATVAFSIPDLKHLLTIPANALMLKPAGSQVCVVRPDNTLHFQTVVIDIDTGKDLGISSGLATGDQVVLNPNEYLSEGLQVEILTDPSDTATGSATSSATK